MLNLSLGSLPQGNCPIVRSSETILPGTHLVVQSSKFDVIEKVPTGQFKEAQQRKVYTKEYQADTVISMLRYKYRV
jgi:hypothetical protein